MSLGKKRSGAAFSGKKKRPQAEQKKQPPIQPSAAPVVPNSENSKVNSALNRPVDFAGANRAHTLFYLDPPYWETEGYGVPFAWDQYELMAHKLKTIKGKAVISINDHPAIRECFKDFEMESLKLDYTVGGGANRVERGELVIYSWNREAEPAGLF